MAMRILHFFPRMPKQADLASYFDIFLEKMAETTELHLAQLTPESTTSQKYTRHCIGNGTSEYGEKGWINYPALKRRYLTLLYGLMPQIVHIHGCYDYISSKVMSWSVQRGFLVVFSPYGGMSPHFIEEEYGMRTWKMILYQKKMATNASCVVVSDKEEEAYLINSKIARRVQYIPDPRDGDYVDLDSYTSSILRIYQKIIDTDMGVHLDKNSREAVCALLHLSLAGENERKPLCPEDILNLRAIAPRQWSNIMIFAMEQGISQYVSQGILKAQLNLPAIDVQQIEQFPALHPKDKNKLESGQLLSDNWLLKRKARKLENVEPVAKKICIMLFNLQYHSQRLTLSLRHLCDLYEVYRFENVDEDFLKNLLEELGLLTFARRINQVLSETIYLEHGFMPVPALDDRGTSIIRNNLIKY